MKKIYQIKGVFIGLLFMCSFAIYGQSSFADKLEHKIVAGFNIGATAPLPIPAEVRAINSFWPEFTPQLGYRIIYHHSPKWGISSGIMLDYKGMGTRDRVKYMHTSVVLVDGEKETLDGFFVGKNETRVKSAYATIPLYVDYTLNSDWNFGLGGFFSYKFSSEFKGKVWDGYMRLEDAEGKPTGDKIEINNGKEATFNFGDDIRDIDLGLAARAERRINNRFGIYGNFAWSLTPIFPSSFKTLSFDLYNIYLTLGLTYKL